MDTYLSLFIFISFNCYIILSSGQIVNDEPGGNLTIMFQETAGFCPTLPAARIPVDPNLVDGRWFGIQVGFLPSQARNIQCMAWDSFFDQQGVLHNFISVIEQGEFKTVTSRLTPINNDGIYSLNVGAPNNDIFISTIYYNDGDIFILGEVVCRENGNHYKNTVIGVRDLQILNYRGALLDQLVRELELEGGYISDKTLISHPLRECMYPELRLNPYFAFPQHPFLPWTT